MMARRVQRSVAVVLAAVAAAAGVGCSGVKVVVPGPPASVTVQLTASPALNPDAQGQSLPTVVRIYVLKSAARLEKADYEPVYGEPREALLDDVLQVEELMVSPGQAMTRVLARDPAARAVAVVAVVRRPAGVTWRAIAQLPAGARPMKDAKKDAPLVFSLEGYRVQQQLP